MKELSLLYRLPSIWISHLICALIALFAPSDIHSIDPDLRSACLVISEIIPSIQGYVRFSEFPGATLLYFSTASILGVLVFLTLARHPKFVLPNAHEAIGTRFKGSSLSYLALGVIFWGALWWVSTFVIFGKPWTFLPIHSARIVLAVIGPIFAFAPFYCAAAMVATVKVSLSFK
jgi:hypothetical protein